ncbi:hypothetical protein [Paenibacillus kobensis]|uniref:hypothetical protein n=1 Tax=Paenibacillus kobensis TaxID=59841 RepID=UPI000FDCB147|nr:hypothetical protein [Paenibacillus kobensis]
MNINRSGNRLDGRSGSIAAALLLALMLAVIAGCGSPDDSRTSSAASASADTTAAADKETVTASLASEPLRNPYEAAGITDPTAFNQMFAKVQTAIAADDRKAVAALALYPIRVNYSEEKSEQVNNAEQFIAKYEQIITPPVKEALRQQKPGELFVNAKGVMAGAGQMWFGATASTPQRYGIIAVNP